MTRWGHLSHYFGCHGCTGPCHCSWAPVPDACCTPEARCVCGWTASPRLCANKEERQGWGLLLLICPRGSLGISINLQISGPVLLAWAVIANLFLLDGRARRCLMSRLGLYLGTGEQAGSRGDAGALQDFCCLFVFFCWDPGAFLLLCKEFCRGWSWFCFIYVFFHITILNILRVKEKLF